MLTWDIMVSFCIIVLKERLAFNKKLLGDFFVAKQTNTDSYQLPLFHVRHGEIRVSVASD